MNAILFALCALLPADAAPTPVLGPVACEGVYKYHLQGVCANERGELYWSFTDCLVKTDAAGKVLVKVEAPNHQGDLCHVDGKVYVAVNLGKFNDPLKRADSWIYVFDDKDLSLLSKHRAEQLVYGAGGIAFDGNRFLVVGGLPEGFEENYVYEFDRQLQFKKQHVLKSGYTVLGIQTAAFADGHWWFGCYGKPAILLKADADLQNVQRFEFDGSLGMVPLAGGEFLVASGGITKEKLRTGRLDKAVADPERGLKFVPEKKVSFRRNTGGVDVLVGDIVMARYRYDDRQVLRPFFQNLCTPSGLQLTRPHPPEEGSELSDHATMHPGLWLSFGDLSGHDFWRNKAEVQHQLFLEEPAGGEGKGSFAVQNCYVSDDHAVCTEDCKFEIFVQLNHSLLVWDSEFKSDKDFYFGDQEEMGLGVRMRPSLAVINGGQIHDSEGRVNEAQVWGKQAKWAVYQGKLGDKNVGVALMPDPNNFRPCWFHARDYGLLVANAFGQNAFTNGDVSKVHLPKGQKLRLRFGVLLFEEPFDAARDMAGAYAEFLSRL